MQHGFDEYFGALLNDMWPYHPGVLHLPMEEGSRGGRFALMDWNKVINSNTCRSGKTDHPVHGTSDFLH